MFRIAINMSIESRVKSSLPKIVNVQLSQHILGVFIAMCMIYSFVRADLVHTWRGGQVLFIGISIPAIISIRDQCRDSSLSQVIEFHETRTKL